MPSEAETRIQQFKQMTESDPENALGHFSLGRAYLEAKRYEDAVASLARVLELSPKMSKAYHLLGEAYEGAGRRTEAVEVMTRGVTVADAQGDNMPRDTMLKCLRNWDEPVPALKAPDKPAVQHTDSGVAATGDFSCARCGSPKGKLDKPPIKGPLGEKIFLHVCTACWREWIPMGTKVVNELGLELSSPKAQVAYDEYMTEFLQLEKR